jgi:hypothetical protein
MRYLVFLLGVGLLGGCAAVDSLKTKNYSPPQFMTWEEYLGSFVGKDISHPQKKFGYSYSTRDLEDGKKAFIWHRANQRSEIYGNKNFIAGSSNTFTWEWSFVANGSGTVINYQWNGNDCPRTVNLN